MKKNGMNILAAALAALAPLAASVALAAEEALQLAPVMVTAEKRLENVQEIPSSVTVLTAGRIEDAGITTIQEMSHQVPNLFIANWGFRGNSFAFIRGIGAINNDPALSFYVDDVNSMDSRVFDSRLFDIERIEVLRGPQGALYGRNSLAGVINIVTKKPGNQTHWGFEQTIGNENLWESAVWLRTPLVKDKLFLGLSGAFERRDGYNTNDFLNEDVDERKGFNGRGQLRWLPNDRMDVLFSIDGESIDDGVFPLTDMRQSAKNPHHVAYDYEGNDRRDTLGSALKVNYKAPVWKLTSITAYRGYDDTTTNDQDFMPYDLITAREDIEDRQFTQELRFASPDDSKSPLKWLAGLYYYNNKKDHLLDLNYGQDAVSMGMTPMAMTQTAISDIKGHGEAVFGQATYTLFDKLELTAGLRYEYGKKELDYTSLMSAGGMTIPGMESVFSNDDDDDAFLPKAQIGYRFRPGFMAYAGLSRGYRSGGFNTAFMDMADSSFGSEFSWNYEIGFKSSWLDNRLTFNTALFYIDLEDQQVTHVLPTANTVIRNAGESRSMGFETEISALITDGLLLEGGFGYTDAEYSEYADGGVDYSGMSTPVAPEYTWNLALQYSLPVTDSFNLFHDGDSLTWKSRAEVQGVGKFYWNDANTLEQDAYELVNLRTGLETEHYAVTFFINNAFDEDYNCVAFSFSGSSALAQAGDPRVFGLILRVNF
ncbi:MAG: TonB-dependent receptor [Desulfobulbaceae bacterium]|jgi:iron complex outermembrane receptor protein|nr:TonB-dependent receptor [Desulfobulbaceae bacterium]